MSVEAYFRRAADRPVPTGGYSDLALVLCVAAIVALMILPLPALAIDALVAVNITFGLLLLMVAIYISAAVEFSVFPSLLLITTLYRLALSIATTRMILTEGHAGNIINTFGSMVAGGDLVVGLVVFLIITLVQFMVIAKGAERVAEVAARFSLDAMPGKQLSIDSDLRSGLIDKDEARRRRRMLELESKLHGSLDGAMKFVKGDAMAGIVIVIINLLGGLAVGVLMQHMSLGDAVQKYSILTIGDGLVTQIPALLASMAAGLMVTRTADEENAGHLGEAIRRQFAGKPRVFLMAGGLAWAMALVPGFPAPVFILLGGGLLTAGVLLDSSVRAMVQARLAPFAGALVRPGPPHLESGAAPAIEARPALPLLLEIAGDGSATLDGVALRQALGGVLDRFELELGVALPALSFQSAHDEGPLHWRLLAFEAPIGEGLLLGDAPVSEAAEAARQALRRHLGLFVGIQETAVMLARAGLDYPEVVKEAARALPLARIAEVMRRLVEEEAPIRNLRDVLEALADAGQREKDAFTLTEFARVALRRQICHRYAADGALRALVLTPETEQELREAVRTTTTGAPQLALEPDVAADLLAAFRTASAELAPQAVIAAIDLRRHIRKLVEPDLFDLPVLSFHELSPDLKLEVVGRVAPRPAQVLLEAAE